MKTKFLLLSITAAIFGSCTTAYKSSQTPDDVYYSPARVYESESEKKREEERKPASDYEITMSIRDYRWRDFSNDYDYDHSPYNYTCKSYSYGYYYNPYYYPWAIYTPKLTYSKPVNTTPRMVNLNAYNGYNSNIASDKTNGTGRWTNASGRYNNNNSNNRRRVILPERSSSSSNETRTYTPSSSGSSSGSSSSGSSSGSSVSRPGRG